MARFASRDLRPSTPIRNFYFTGSDVSTAGVAGALVGAVTTASAVLRRNMFGLMRAGTKERAAAHRRAA